MGKSRRQWMDAIEHNAQYHLFGGFLLGCALAQLYYFRHVTTRRRFRMGIRFSLLLSAVSVPYTWFTNPVCQWPNRGELQRISQDQAFKNFVIKCKEKWPIVRQDLCN